MRKIFVVLLSIVFLHPANAQWIQSGLGSQTVNCLIANDSAMFAGTPSGAFKSTSRLFVTEYLIPRANAFPHDPAVGADGVAWYTDQTNSYIGKLDPTTGIITDYPTPTANSGPHGITVAPDGFVWYTAQSAGRIGKVNPSTGATVEFVLPSATNAPHTPIWHGGYIWYTAQGNNAYGKLNPVTGAVNTYSAPAGSNPYGIAPAPDGSLWIALFGTNKLGRVDTATGAMQLFNLPNASARPRRLTVASNGLVYYTDYQRGYLGRLDPATGDVREWLAPDTPPGAYGIAIGTDGRVWFNAVGTSAMIAFDPTTERMDTVTIPTAGATVRNMVCDYQRGVLWLALSGTQRIGRLELVRRNWIASGLASNSVNAFAATGAGLFAGTANGVFRSTNNGASWNSANVGLPGFAVSSLLADGSRLFAGLRGGGIFLSTNGGANWSAMNNGLTQLSVESIGLVNSVLFVGTQNGVFRSTDGANSWTEANTGLPNPSQSRANAFVGIGANIYAALSDVSPFAGGVFMSTNNGASWTSRSSGLNNRNVVALANQGGVLYAGTSNDGVYVSSNSASTWTRYATGLTGSSLQTHALAVSGRTLLVGTDDGVWMQSPSIVTSVLHQVNSDVPSDFVLHQNYPNPFNPTTTIRYDLPYAGLVSLKIFDILGREVATLVNEVQNAGFKSVEFSASELASGVYFYKLNAGNFSASKKLLIVK